MKYPQARVAPIGFGSGAGGRLNEVSPDLHLVQVRVRLGNSADQTAEVAVLRPLKDDVQLVLLVVN